MVTISPSLVHYQSETLLKYLSLIQIIVQKFQCPKKDSNLHDLSATIQTFYITGRTRTDNLGSKAPMSLPITLPLLRI